MKKLTQTLAALAITTLALSGCGKNPFGPGAEGGLSIFAKIGKAMTKPSAVNDENNGKDGVKNTLNTGSAKAYLGKAMSGENRSTVISCGIDDMLTANTYMYYEVVANKPSEEDAQKLMTGRGEVVFKYTGDPHTNFSLVNVTDVISWHFIGREEKTWSGVIDTLNIMVTFSSTSVGDIKPGLTTAWGKNISPTLEQGKDDTAYFSVDSLDDTRKIQFGEGRFYDAHTGRDNTEGPKSFNFDLQIFHMGTYADYSDNEGILTFIYPWGDTGDSLYFMIHFYPNYRRTGEIHKNTADGTLLVEFDHNEKSGTGWVKYYDKDGNVVSEENN